MNNKNLDNKLTAPALVRGGKNSKEKNFDPLSILELILSARDVYVYAYVESGDGGLELFEDPLLDDNEHVSHSLKISFTSLFMLTDSVCPEID